jgi:hypothetical protein
MNASTLHARITTAINAIAAKISLKIAVFMFIPVLMNVQVLWGIEFILSSNDLY